jgi:acyl-CoA thioesterase FadM
VEYKRPARLGNLLGIETRLSRAGGRSITFEQQAAIIPGEEPAAIAQVTNVFFRTRGGEVVKVDDGVFDPWEELKDIRR